jgi:hypothetical protein
LILADNYINKHISDELTIQEFDSILEYYTSSNLKIDKRTLPQTQLKRKITMLKRYGVEYASSIRHLKKKAKLSNKYFLN